MPEQPDQSVPETMADRKARLAAWKEQKMKAAAEKQKAVVRSSSTSERRNVAPEPSFQQQRIRQSAVQVVSELPYQRDPPRHCSPKSGDLTPTSLAGSKRETGPRVPLQQRPNRRDSSEGPTAAAASPSKPNRAPTTNAGGGAQPQLSRISIALSSSGSGLSWPGSTSSGADEDEGRYEVLQAELLQWQYANLRLEQVCLLDKGSACLSYSGL